MDFPTLSCRTSPTRSRSASRPFSEPARGTRVAFRQASITDRSVGSTLREIDIDYFTGEDTNVAKFELYKSSNDEYRWRLKASNGQVIATGGEGYSSPAMDKSLPLVERGTPRVLGRREASMRLSASLLPLQ